MLSLCKLKESENCKIFIARLVIVQDIGAEYLQGTYVTSELPERLIAIMRMQQQLLRQYFLKRSEERRVGKECA